MWDASVHSVLYTFACHETRMAFYLFIMLCVPVRVCVWEMWVYVPTSNDLLYSLRVRRRFSSSTHCFACQYHVVALSTSNNIVVVSLLQKLIKFVERKKKLPFRSSIAFYFYLRSAVPFLISRVSGCFSLWSVRWVSQLFRHSQFLASIVVVVVEIIAVVVVVVSILAPSRTHFWRLRKQHTHTHTFKTKQKT